jgi:hypothetical protein
MTILSRHGGTVDNDWFHSKFLGYHILTFSLHPDILKQKIFWLGFLEYSDVFKEEFTTRVVKIETFTGEGEPLTRRSAHQEPDFW